MTDLYYCPTCDQVIDRLQVFRSLLAGETQPKHDCRIVFPLVGRYYSGHLHDAIPLATIGLWRAQQQRQLTWAQTIGVCRDDCKDCLESLVRGQAGPYATVGTRDAVLDSLAEQRTKMTEANSVVPLGTPGAIRYFSHYPPHRLQPSTDGDDR